MDAPGSVTALRRRLEATYGLALSSLSDDQLHRAALEAGREADLGRIADRLPISESSLMRDPELWAWLQAHYFERAFAQAQLERRPLRALSMGCSDGQEVFSLAMTALNTLIATGFAPSQARAHVEIHGVDISPARIARARAGMLAEWSIRGAPPAGAAAFVHKEPNAWRVAERVRAICHFEVGNLLTFPPERLAEFDLVLCRHVLIYFAPDSAAAAIAQLTAGLRPGAHFGVAPVESHLLPERDSLERVGPVGLVRALSPAPRARPSPAAHAGEAASDAPAAGAVSSAPIRFDPGEPSSAEAHRTRALQAAEAGRLQEALTLARAATYLEPRHLGGRFLLARLQLLADPPLGRRLLQAVADEARHADDSDPELSNHQLALAASALLASSR